MSRIQRTLVPGLELEIRVSEELVREYRECAADTDCKSCGWRAQMMRVFLGGNASGQADPVPVHRCL